MKILGRLYLVIAAVWFPLWIYAVATDAPIAGGGGFFPNSMMAMGLFVGALVWAARGFEASR